MGECRAKIYKDNSVVTHFPLVCFGGFGQPRCPYLDICAPENNMKKEKIKRVLLTTTRVPKGAFSRLVGPSQIELVQMLKNKPRKIFDDRFWGDLGFIHLCFDVHDMMGLEKECAQKGFPFTVDSPDPFNMGGVECHFSYIEDPDGTLIEFVETYKIPTVKKLGWYLDLKKRDPEKPLPNWMIKLLSLSRVKD